MMNWPFVDGKTIIGLRVCALIQWVDKSWPIKDDLLQIGDQPLFALPPLQRDAVWRPKQVVDLWDSLLRGLPIGILYLVRQPEGTDRDVVTKEGKTIRVNFPGYDLLDGQQRIRALLLGAVGFSEEKRCLWVDLGNEESARRPVLYITSEGQPFGYDVKTGNKLSLDERRRARERIEDGVPFLYKDEAGTARPAYDRELFSNDKITHDGKRIHPQPPRPYGASDHTFKLHDLLNAWQKRDPNTGDEGVAALRTTTGNGPHREALVRLHEAFERIEKAEVALLLVNPQSITDRENLLKLFDRIGAGGTPLSVEERLYSIYKYHWPKVRDAVNRIHYQVGRVLSPTKIAATAIRIAYARSKDDRNSTPDVATFSKIVTDQNERHFQKCLEQLIPSQEANDNTTLLDSFQTIKTILCWNKGVGHFWIPEVLLTSLPAELWQVFVFWAVRHHDQANVMRSRQEAVRFALFWHLCVWNHEKAARLAFDHIKKSEDTADFSGAALYKLLTGGGDERCAHGLIPSEEFERRLCKSETPMWRTDTERFMENDTRNELGSHWWWRGTQMLPWLQRDYVREKFQDYVPLTDHEDDLPYDVDHICPKKDWLDDWRKMEKRLAVGNELKEKIYRCRDSVGNGVGNLQILSSSENRAKSAVDLVPKLPFSLDDSVPPTDVERKAMADFAFNPKDRGLWQRVSRPGEVSKRRWDEDRLKAFQQAVEKRAVWLYQCFHDELNFGLWTKRIEDEQFL